jgi:hypothetical protein
LAGVAVLDGGAHPFQGPRMSANASLGFGLGLRPVHYPEIFDRSPRVDWFEVI